LLKRDRSNEEFSCLPPDLGESHSAPPLTFRAILKTDGFGGACDAPWLSYEPGKGCSRSTTQPPHIQGLRSPPEKKIASAAVITTRSNRALSRLKSTMETKNSASTRPRVTLVIVIINSGLRSGHDSDLATYLALKVKGDCISICWNARIRAAITSPRSQPKSTEQSRSE